MSDIAPGDPLNNLPLFPDANLESGAMPWARRIQKELLALMRSTRRQINYLNNANKRTTATLSSQGRTLIQLAATQVELASIQDDQAQILIDVQKAVDASGRAISRLDALARSEYASSNAQFGNFTGFYTGTKPEVTITSPTGKLQLQFGGSLNGGSGYFVYTVIRNDTGEAFVNRDTVVEDPSRRVALSGGASFSPSGYNTIVISVPANVSLTVRCEVYAESTFVTFVGRSIFAQVAP